MHKNNSDNMALGEAIENILSSNNFDFDTKMNYSIKQMLETMFLSPIHDSLKSIFESYFEQIHDNLISIVKSYFKDITNIATNCIESHIEELEKQEQDAKTRRLIKALKIANEIVEEDGKGIHNANT